MSRHQKFKPHHNYSSDSQNKLRAAVLGANDGIVSIAGLVVGVAGATTSRNAILTAGITGTAAGAFSMAVGEYVSVSSQRDSEKALLKLEKSEIASSPAKEQEELTQIYIAKGLSDKTAEKVAAELSSKNALRAHLDAELSINPDKLVNPWQAASSSALAFCAGALLPLLAILLPPKSNRVAVAFVAVLVALIISGYLSAKSSQAPVGVAIARVVAGGALAMIVTYTIGSFVGSNLS